MEIIRDKDRTRICLNGELTISRATELKEAMMQALAGSDTIEIDLKDVTRIDLSFLQLSCAAHRTAIQSGKDFFFTNRGNEIVQQARKQAGFVFMRGCVHNPTKNCLWVGGME